MEPEKRRKIIKYSIIAIVVLIVGYFVGWIIYHKPAFNGCVIDAETKEPIEGAVVVAIYEAYTPSLPIPVDADYIPVGVKEVLTDKNGKFHIDPYTTIMLPYQIRAGVKFVIYKPGYGSYPDYHVSPPSPGVGPEEFFLGELGTEGEVEWLSKKIKVTYGVVELPKMRTWEERDRSMSSANIRGDFPDRKIKNLIRFLNEERKNLGLTPYRK